MSIQEVLNQFPWGGVAIATLFSMVLGGLWYGPLFGKSWMKLAGIEPKNLDRRKAMNSMLATVGTSLIENFTFGLVILFAGFSSAFGGSVLGLLIGLGMVSTQMTSSIFFEQRPVALWRINSSFRVAALTVNGAILGAFL